MKNSKVAQLCKASRDIVLVNMDEGGRRPVQWVGTAQALYPLHGMPTMNKAQIYALFDVTEKQEGKIRFTEKTADKIGFSIGDFDGTERMIEPRGIGIVYGGCVYVPFDTSKGIRLIDRAYIMAMVKDIDILSFYERQTSGGTIYIVARMGLLLAGVLMPRYNAGGDNHLAAFARKFSERMQVAQDFAEAERVAEDTRSGDEQLSLVNMETGEIVEDGADEPGEGYRTVFHGESQDGETFVKVTLVDGTDETDEDDDGGDAA